MSSAAAGSELVLLLALVLGAVVMGAAVISHRKKTQGRLGRAGRSEPGRKISMSGLSFLEFTGSPPSGDSQPDLRPALRLKRAGEPTLTEYRVGDGEGMDEIRGLLEGDPENALLLEWLAFSLYTNGDIDEAIETYERLVQVDPDNPAHRFYLGNCYYKRKRMPMAVACWEKVVALAPDGALASKARKRAKRATEQVHAGSVPPAPEA